MIKDSGNRTEFSTGAVRDIQEGKGRFDLLSPIALTELAKHMEEGANKYGDRNWEKGIPMSRYIDSGIRHLMKFLKGDQDERHLVAAFWNLHGAVHTFYSGNYPQELYDLPWMVEEYERAVLEAKTIDYSGIHVTD